MLSRLDLISSSFHAFNLATLIFVGHLWHHRYAEEPAIRPLPLPIATDLAVVGLIALLSAGIFAAAGGANARDLINLLSQWGFGEFLLLLSAAAFVLRRGRAYLPSLG